MVAIMTMLSFRSAPREGPLNQVKRICGYLSDVTHPVIPIHTNEPDYSGISRTKYNQEFSVYSGAKEEILKDGPEPLGKPDVITAYVDANPYLCMLTGKSGFGGFTLLQQNPSQLVCKEARSSAETATYAGSGYVHGRTVTKQVIDNSLSIRYLWSPCREKLHVW